MATQLFLLDSVADTHLAADNANLIGSFVGWTSRALGLARGSGVVASDAVATVAGTTTGIVITKTSPVEWISPPLSADVTIAGTITVNIWASESNTAANVAINAVIDVIRANATATRNSNTIVEIARTARVTEVAVTTRAVNNFTVTPTSTVVNRGDRLRVRIYGDDAVTMGTGRTFNVSWAGATAAADGDSYLTLTETATFDGVGSVLDQTDTTGGALIVGSSATLIEMAQSFVASGVLSEVRAWLQKASAPVDNLILEVQTDSSGVPSGAVVGTVATVAGASLTTTSTQYTYSGLSIALSAGVTYWLVIRRSSGVADATNNYLLRRSVGAVSGFGNRAAYNSGTTTWSTTGSSAIAVRLTMVYGGPGGSTLYLTDTASAVSTASVDREAWTSRGAGVQTDVRNTAAGWTAPLQVTDTAGGTVVDWFTKPLTAFTLTGMAVANLRALESNAAANASLRCEIARVEGDGTSPTVWASWCVAPITTDNGELGTTEAARTVNVSGDDLAITNGQRLRIRVYADDISQAAMAASQTVTLYYAGTSAAASGDSYITLPQTVTEFASGTPGPATLLSTRRLAANRYLTSR